MFYVQAFQRVDLVSSAIDDLFDSAIHLPLDEFYVHVQDLNCYYNPKKLIFFVRYLIEMTLRT